MSTTSIIIGWIVVIILIILNILTAVAIVTSKQDLHQCENSESQLCPSIFCNNTIEECQSGSSSSVSGQHSGSAFRTNANGNYVCQTYLIGVTEMKEFPPTRRTAGSWQPLLTLSLRKDFQ
jgi:hypothetical protein